MVRTRCGVRTPWPCRPHATEKRAGPEPGKPDPGPLRSPPAPAPPGIRSWLLGAPRTQLPALARPAAAAAPLGPGLPDPAALDPPDAPHAPRDPQGPAPPRDGRPRPRPPPQPRQAARLPRPRGSQAATRDEEARAYPARGEPCRAPEPSRSPAVASAPRAAPPPPHVPPSAREAGAGRRGGDGPEGARQAVAAPHWSQQASLIRVANGRRPGRGYRFDFFTEGGASGGRRGFLGAGRTHLSFLRGPPISPPRAGLSVLFPLVEPSDRFFFSQGSLFSLSLPRL